MNWNILENKGSWIGEMKSFHKYEKPLLLGIVVFEDFKVVIYEKLGVFTANLIGAKLKRSYQ
jgi:hypothetical protein